MPMPQLIDKKLFRNLLSHLGYTRDAGYVDLDRPGASPTESFLLLQARERMNALGAFGLNVWPTQGDQVARRFRPLVYVIEAANDTDAQEMHKRVWSQGFVPLLLVVTPAKIWACRGFSFSSASWNVHAQAIKWSDFPEKAEETLSHYYADRLRSSLAWRDFASDPKHRIDSHLLDNLKALSSVFTSGRYGTKTFTKLGTRTANSLIGRLLYVYFLRDRGIIDSHWLSQRHGKIAIDDVAKKWPIHETWAFFDHLDNIFNGSIFPLSPGERRRISSEHIQIIREVLRHGYQPTPGGVQLGFVDVYLPTLRTETLSAVYEHFLETEDSERKADEGAFYTPPFLADYVLDRLEEMLTRSDGSRGVEQGVKVFDGAAGSGVFLVGAYRRMVESALRVSGGITLPVEDLRRILHENIFAVERRRAACQIAAFGLYLTLLDYASVDDLRTVAEGAGTVKLFPPLVGTNILIRDFFDTRPFPSGFPSKFDCIVGNPPWKKTKDIRSWRAVQYRDRHSEDMPIDQDRVSELFAWKCASEHLRDGGTMGMLIPVKSLISPSAKRFSSEFFASSQVVGVANFSHFRYKMFVNADAAAAAIFVERRKPDSRAWVWVHSPTLAGQPVCADGWPWTIMVDRADVSTFRYASISATSRGWFESITLRPIDRKILGYLSDFCELGRGATFGSLKDELFLKIDRGGSPTETGVDKKYLLGTGKEVENNYLERLGLAGPRTVEPEPYDFPEVDRESIAAPFRSRFAGNVLLLTRNGKGAHFVQKPVAFVSSLLVIYFDRPDRAKRSISRAERDFLRAVQRYLNSAFFQYVMVLYGRLWTLDVRRFDPEDLRSVPVPFTSLDDIRVQELLRCAEENLTKKIVELFSMPRDLGAAVLEFPSLREGFRNGGVPKEALDLPAQKQIERYRGALKRRLDGFVSTSGKFRVLACADSARALGAVNVVFSSSDAPLGAGSWSETDVLREAEKRYDLCGASVYTDSLFVNYERDVSRVLLVKPLLAFHWTIERAFSDGGEIIGKILASPRAS
jgi:hypothetical protein